MQNNQFSLHAKEGCTLAPNTSTPYTGTQIYTDCNYVFNVGHPPFLHARCGADGRR
jgi:hypothetical protein